MLYMRQVIMDEVLHMLAIGTSMQTVFFLKKNTFIQTKKV